MHLKLSIAKQHHFLISPDSVRKVLRDSRTNRFLSRNTKKRLYCLGAGFSSFLIYVIYLLQDHTVRVMPSFPERGSIQLLPKGEDN